VRSRLAPGHRTRAHTHPSRPTHERSWLRRGLPPAPRADHFPDAYVGQNTKIRDTLNNLILKVSGRRSRRFRRFRLTAPLVARAVAPELADLGGSSLCAAPFRRLQWRARTLTAPPFSWQFSKSKERQVHHALIRDPPAVHDAACPMRRSLSGTRFALTSA